MEQLHAHEVLHMMEGNSYSESSLKEAIIQKFGEHQHFYTCSAEDMDADKLIEFLKAKGKFMPADGGYNEGLQPLMLMHPSSPYQVHTKSVSSPSKGTFIRTRYGLGTDLTGLR